MAHVISFYWRERKDFKQHTASGVSWILHFDSFACIFISTTSTNNNKYKYKNRNQLKIKRIPVIRYFHYCGALCSSRMISLSSWSRFVGMLVIFIILGMVMAEDDNNNSNDPSCGLWLGPSHIKETTQHGFGLGMYTGRAIRKGETMSSEMFIPVYDIDDEGHPPLREYLWNGEAHKQIVLEVLGGMLFFTPGLAAIAPCSSNNFNLELIDKLSFDNADVHRSKDPTVGSFTYYNSYMFRAVRDILPGEEFTVECSDDDFDASSEHWTYDPTQHFCLDDKVEERPRSNLPGVGRGVFAKKELSQNSLILSSPAVPMLRDILNIDSLQPKGIQLLYNYCYGHPESDLLWLPYGPIINSVNHSHKAPNVKIQWHSDPLISNKDLARRKQYHHPELLEETTERVAVTHGKGLVMELIALRDIQPGEELYLDYGTAWEEAWNQHKTKYLQNIAKLPDLHSYFPSAAYNPLHSDETLRTITEQHRDPYPPNLVTACRFQEDWIEDEAAEDYEMIQYQSWDTQENHFNCLLPCILLERLQDETNASTHRYTAKLVDHHHENENIEYTCHIFRQFEYIYTDIPRIGIEFIENTYRSDVFLPAAFRHPIQVSEGMYPDLWMRQRVRRRATSNPPTQTEVEDPDQFKRKNLDSKPNKDDIQRKLMASPRTDL